MIESIDNDNFENVWKVVLEIGTQERHFNTLQGTYRGMASAWLFASFSAIGFMTSKTISIGIDSELLVAGIAVAGCVGIALLWVIDLLVYQRLLDSCFIEGLILEDKYPWLPPFRHNMMRTQKGEGVLFRVVGFYLGPVVLLIMIAGGSLALWLLQSNHFLASSLTGVLSLVTAMLVGIDIRRKTENSAAVVNRLAEAKHNARCSLTR